MKLGNIAILKTSSASVVLRPSKIVGIKVEDGTFSQSISTPIEQLKENQVQNQEEDIITDVDN